VTAIKCSSLLIEKVSPLSGSLVNEIAAMNGQSKEAPTDTSGEFVMISHGGVRERNINLEGCGWLALNLL
jgi:hypothetical protein